MQLFSAKLPIIEENEETGKLELVGFHDGEIVLPARFEHQYRSAGYRVKLLKTGLADADKILFPTPRRIASDPKLLEKFNEKHAKEAAKAKTEITPEQQAELARLNDENAKLVAQLAQLQAKHDAKLALEKKTARGE